MRVVSMIGDHFGRRIPETYPRVIPTPAQQVGPYGSTLVTREEFEALKKTVDEMMLLLKAAKKYDEDNGEPDCEMDEKMAKLRQIAKLVGVDFDEVLKSNT